MLSQDSTPPPINSDSPLTTDNNKNTNSSNNNNNNNNNNNINSNSYYYYDANLDWVPTTPLRRLTHKCYPILQNTFYYMEACGKYFVNVLGLDESGYEYIESERESIRRRGKYIEKNEDDNEEEEEEEEEEESNNYNYQYNSIYNNNNYYNSNVNETEGIEAAKGKYEKELIKMRERKEKEGSAIVPIHNNNNISNNKIGLTLHEERWARCVRLPRGFPIDDLPDEPFILTEINNNNN